MIPDHATVIEFQPGSPTVQDRQTLFSDDATETLKAILTRFGLPPFQIGTEVGGKANQEVHITGRDYAGKPTVFARLLYGASLKDIEAARAALIEEGWEPKAPKFLNMILPDGREI